MPITLKSSTDTRVGLMPMTLGAITVDFDGTHTLPANRDGNITTTVGGALVTFQGQFAVPASRDGDITATLGSPLIQFIGNQIQTIDGQIDATVGGPTVRFTDVDLDAQKADFRVLPDWSEEQAAYALEGLTTTSAELDIVDANNATVLSNFVSHSNETDTHNDTEGDFLWTAFHMHKRLNGIRASAASEWLTRRNNLVTFFRDNYVNQTAWNADESNNHDHLYGWGLADYAIDTADATAITTLNTMVTELVAWNANDFTISPGNTDATAAFGRRWARQLRFAVRAAEASPIAANISWRDTVIDIVTQLGNWDEAYIGAGYNALYLGNSGNITDNRLDTPGQTYAGGARLSNTFHMGIMVDALWHAWRVMNAESDSRADLCAQRLVDLATFYLSIPLTGDTGMPTGGSGVSGFLHLSLGYNINDQTPCYELGEGTPDGVYTLCPCNGLIQAYKLTGQTSYRDRAWTLYKNWQASPAVQNPVGAGAVSHYVDSQITANPSDYLRNNKGELQYAYALFENNGNPTAVSGYRPSWYTAANDNTWIDMTAAVGAYEWNGGEINPVNGSAILPANQIGITTGSASPAPAPDAHKNAIEKWCGACAREDYYIIAFAGGHNGGSGNVIYEFGPFTSESPNWHHFGLDPTKYQRPSDNLAWSSERCRDSTNHYTDGLPVSRHTYSKLIWVPDVNGVNGGQVFAPNATGVWCDTTNSGGSKASSATFRSTGDVGADYDAEDTWQNAPFGVSARYGSGAFDPVTGRVHVAFHGSDGAFYYYDRTTKNRTLLNGSVPGFGTSTYGATDYVRRIHVQLKQSESRILVYDIDHDGRVGGSYGAFIDKSGVGLAGLSGREGSMVYHPESNAFILYNGGSQLYKLEPPSNYRSGGATGTLNSGASWSLTTITNGSGGATPPAENVEGNLQTRFQYISSINAFAVQINSGDGGTNDRFFVYKPAASGL